MVFVQDDSIYSVEMVVELIVFLECFGEFVAKLLEAILNEQQSFFAFVLNYIHVFT